MPLAEHYNPWLRSKHPTSSPAGNHDRVHRANVPNIIDCSNLVCRKVVWNPWIAKRGCLSTTHAPDMAWQGMREFFGGGLSSVYWKNFLQELCFYTVSRRQVSYYTKPIARDVGTERGACEWPVDHISSTAGFQCRILMYALIHYSLATSSILKWQLPTPRLAWQAEVFRYVVLRWGNTRWDVYCTWTSVALPPWPWNDYDHAIEAVGWYEPKAVRPMS